MNTLLAFLLMASAPLVTIGMESTGYLDVAKCDGFSGWTSAAKVSLYIDGKYSKTITANQPRPDVEAAGYGKNHGFSFKLPDSMLDGQPHRLAVRVTGATNELHGSPLTLTCGSGPAPTPCPPCPCASPSPSVTPTVTPAPPAKGAKVQLNWQHPSPTPGDLLGYRLLLGPSSNAPVMANDLPVTTTTNVDLPAGNWFISLETRTRSGESAPSAEVKFP